MNAIPTIGRVVWYYPGRNEGLGINPLAGIIAAVHSESRIAIGGFTATGASFARQNIAFVQADEEPVLDHTGINGYAKWPAREPKLAREPNAAPAPAPKPEQVVPQQPAAQQPKQGAKA